MIAKLRIWRVVPTSKTGAKAPYFFVETEKFELDSAMIEADKKARESNVLSKFDNWSFPIIKMKVRKDGLGRYWANHQ